MKQLLIFIFLFLSSVCRGQLSITRISGTIFDLDVYTVIGVDTAKARTFVNYMFKDSTACITENFENRGTTFYKPGYPIIMWLPTTIKNIEELSITNHEIFHVVSSLLNWVGIKLSNETEELYAYTYQYYSKIIYTIINKEDENTKNRP